MVTQESRRHSLCRRKRLTRQQESLKTQTSISSSPPRSSGLVASPTTSSDVTVNISLTTLTWILCFMALRRYPACASTWAPCGLNASYSTWLLSGHFQGSHSRLTKKMSSTSNSLWAPVCHLSRWEEIHTKMADVWAQTAVNLPSHPIFPTCYHTARSHISMTTDQTLPKP